MSARKVEVPLPTDTQLLDWMNTTDCTIRRYNTLAAPIHDTPNTDTDGHEWHVYNRSNGRSADSDTLRGAMQLAWKRKDYKYSPWTTSWKRTKGDGTP